MRRMMGCLTLAMLVVLSAQLTWAEIDQKVEVFPQLGPAHGIHSIAFSPDGRYALSGSYKTLRLWDVATGREFRRFEGHTAGATSVAFSPDGRFALSGGWDKTLRLWDVATGRELRRFEGHTNSVKSVTFSPDGRFALSGSEDMTLRLWDVATGREIRRFEGHTKMVESVAFSPDGRFALSGSWDDTVRLWDVATGRELRRFEGHTASVNSVAFSPNGRLAISGGFDDTLRLWDVATGRELRRFKGHTSLVTSIAFSPDGRSVLSGSWDYTVRLWDIATGGEVRRFVGHGTEVEFVAFSPDGRSALSGYSTQLRLWDVATGREIRRFEGHASLAVPVSFSPDGRLALSGGFGDNLQLWDVATGRKLRQFEGHGLSVLTVAFSSNGRLALSGGWDKTLRLWDVATGKELRRFEGHTDPVTSVAFSPDGRSALSGDWGELRLWDVATGREIRRFKGHVVSFADTYKVEATFPPYLVTSVAFSPDGRYALSGSIDKTLRLWDVATGKELRRFEGHENHVNSVAFSPDGRSALSGSSDGTLRLWEVTTGKELRRFEGHTGDVTSVAFSPDGRLALSSGHDFTLLLWDVATGKELRRFQEHEGTSVAFSRDGRFALIGSDTMRLWSIATGQEIATFVGFTDGEWIVITPEGYYSASLAGHQHLNARMGNDVYGMDQFYEAFYRPDLVEKKLKGENIAQFTAGLNLTEALKNPPPQVTILSPKERDALRERTITVKVRIDDRGGGIGDMRLHHNGKLVDSLGVYRLAKTETNEPRVLAAKADPSPYRTTRGTTLRAVMQERAKAEIRTAAFTPLTGTQERTYTITLTKGENTISISASNGTNLVMSVPHSITIKADIPERKPELFVLSVGNDHFANRSYNLTQAITDARDFTATVTKLVSPHYAKVHAQILTDTTKSAILDAIHTMTARMHPEDTFILFSATHGRAEDDLYYLYTADFDGDLSNPKSFLSSVELMELSKKLPALKQVVILDTCQAGALETIIAGLYDAKVSVLARALGMHIFSGTKTYQDALDNYKGNGLFTHFILSGLQGQADANQNREVSVVELNPYLTKTVKEASRGTQEPVVRHFGEDLPLTRSALRPTP